MQSMLIDFDGKDPLSFEQAHQVVKLFNEQLLERPEHELPTEFVRATNKTPATVEMWSLVVPRMVSALAQTKPPLPNDNEPYYWTLLRTILNLLNYDSLHIVAPPPSTAAQLRHWTAEPAFTVRMSDDIIAHVALSHRAIAFATLPIDATPPTSASALDWMPLMLSAEWVVAFKQARYPSSTVSHCGLNDAVALVAKHGAISLKKD